MGLTRDDILLVTGTNRIMSLIEDIDGKLTEIHNMAVKLQKSAPDDSTTTTPGKKTNAL